MMSYNHLSALSVIYFLFKELLELMITMYIACLLTLTLHSLTIQRRKPIALVICIEMLALSNIIMWLVFLKSRVALVVMAITFWLMFFIVIGATITLVLLSITLISAPHPLKIFC